MLQYLKVYSKKGAVLVRVLFAIFMVHGTIFMQTDMDQGYVLRPSRQITVLADTLRFGRILDIHYGNSRYYLTDIDSGRILELNNELELINTIGGPGMGMQPMNVETIDDSLFIVDRSRMVFILYDDEIVRLFQIGSPLALPNMALTHDAILYGNWPQLENPIVITDHNGTPLPDYADGFGEWGGDLDIEKSSVDVFIGSRAEIIAVLRSQPYVQRYSGDLELKETYDLTSFEIVDRRWNWVLQRRMQNEMAGLSHQRNSMKDDRLYILTQIPSEELGFEHWEHGIVILQISPDEITPVGTVRLTGPVDGQALSIPSLCAGPNNVLIVYDRATESLLLYKIPI